MTKYVLKSTTVIALEALPANELRTLSSGVYVFVSRRLSSYLQLSRHIDGHDYFYALSEMLESARERIFIMVWIIPPVYLCHSHDFGQGLVVDT
jgi:hypothetical protein